MTKQEFISMSLPYGLKAEFKEVDNSTSRKKVIGTINAVYDDGTIVCHDTVNATPSKFKPIVRPLSDLTKECVQANYNYGKPFIPIVDLATIRFGTIEVIEVKSDKDISGVRFIDEDFDFMVFAYHYSVAAFGAHVEVKRGNEQLTVYYQLDLFQQLAKWHFDLIDEDCEKLYVTDQFNPYK